ncbi:DUF2946 domain-containing protein [Paraburkholderia acidicola]|uniref:DUF2946 domain-containing protein n=1 Tax=Paraburkholderia acidicola TaxID=1912599 RepID=A0ABV1LUG1_9BURK
MSRIRLLKLGSLLGLLAILMSTFAPTISQALAAHDRLGQALATYCSADTSASASPQDNPPAHGAALHWQACAYCGLLAHLPVLPGTTTSFAASRSVAPALVLVVQNEVRPLLAYTAAQPRAPPAFS